MAQITGAVHHLNLSVSNLERSAEWYRDLFDLDEIARVSADDGAWSKLILRHPAGLLIGLTQHDRNDAEPFAEWRSGFDHVALVVADLAELADWGARLDERRIDRSAVKTTPLGALITIRDPDNVQLELYAPHPAAGAAET